MKVKRQLKTKLHFNRINMQRGNPNVWTAHTSKACHQAEKIQIVHKGKVVAETVFKPESNQPRAFFVATGEITMRDSVAVLEVK
jgi:hypothetical protein